MCIRDSTRTVCRHTLIKNESLGYHEDYARLDNLADPDFIEAKGYVFVGNSRNNLSIDNMPSHSEVMEFSEKLAPMVGREVLSDRRESRVALIGREMIPVTLPEKTRDLPADLGIAKPQKFSLPQARTIGLLLPHSGQSCSSLSPYWWKHAGPVSYTHLTLPTTEAV